LGVIGRVAIVASLLALTLASSTSAADAPLVVAAKRDDGAAVRVLLKRKVSADQSQADGATALHWAAHWDNLAMADDLLQAGARANAVTDLGVTPLWLASLNGSAAMIERLLKAGANANIALPSGETPLMIASRAGAVAAVKLLAAHGAQVNARETTKNQTALMWATVQGHADVVEALLEAGADVAARSSVRMRRVNTEAGGFQAGLVMDVEQGGYTPLLFAAQQGNVASARLLVAAGAKIDDRAPDGSSVLVVASLSGNGPLAAYLLDKGADANDGGSGYTALHAAIVRNDPALVKALLSHGADPNATIVKPTGVRRSSADYALEAGHVGASPLWLAARFAQPDVMRLLLAQGAKTGAPPKDGTPLLVAAAQGTRRVEPGFTRDLADDERRVTDAVEIALELGADINAQNKDANTALHVAAQRRMKAVVRLLVARGATLDQKNAKGQTPLGIAGRDSGDDSVAQLLRDAGGK
jgi:uncharacterized protein